ncbi:hypothetical protein LPJ59_006253, partial [Coemansia sp. RSA 2399]
MTTMSSIHTPSLHSSATTNGDVDYTKWSRSTPLMPRPFVQTNRPERSGLQPISNNQTDEPSHSPLVTFDYFVARNCNSLQVPEEVSRTMKNALPREAPARRMGALRRATTRLRGASVRSPPPAAMPPLSNAMTSRPVPIHRSKTLDDFPWEVVAVPLPHLQNSDSLVDEDAQPAWPPVSVLQENGPSQDERDVVARGVMELRRDGLPSRQWYVPESFSVADRRSENTPRVGDIDQSEMAHRGSSSGTATQTATPESSSPASSSDPQATQNSEPIQALNSLGRMASMKDSIARNLSDYGLERLSDSR